MVDPSEASRIERLLAFLPDFESGAPPGTPAGGERQPDGSFTMPWFQKSELVVRFEERCYKDGWIRPDFDWAAWQPEGLRYWNDPGLIAAADLETLERLLTLYIRQDRFSEGHLAAAIDYGQITAILRRLRDLAAPNIFELMQRVSTRIEPYHSGFLGAMLKWSLLGDRRLFDAIWNLVAPKDWTPPANADVLAEDVIGNDRVDLVLLAGTRYVIGIEVKTREMSTTPGQLHRYREGLESKYPERELAVAYLTPFDRRRAGDAALLLRSIQEFDEFAATFPRARHVSWLDIADIEWSGGSLWEQHREFVRTTISSEPVRTRWMTQGRTRGFAEFFGEEAAELFDQQLTATVGELEGSVLDLRNVDDPAALASAFRVLIESNTVKGARGKADAFDVALRTPFLESPFGVIHEALFALAADHSNVWVEGKRNYGLRVAHPNHAGGVSIATSIGTDRIEIGRPR